MNRYWMKEPCEHCPFRRDVTPYLTMERAEQLAYATENEYNSFACHKTTEYNEDLDDQVITQRSLECAGFLTMQTNYCKDVPEGFVPSDKAYIDSLDMISAYEQFYE